MKVTVIVCRKLISLFSYHLAKTASLFTRKNSTQLTDVISTYKSSSFKRCADLCQSSKETICKSINYCSKTRQCTISSSHLSESNESGDEDDCVNYEYIRESNSPNSQQPMVEAQSGPVVGIIFAFIFIGLIAGFAGFNGYKMASRRIGKNSTRLLFAWSRQDDEQ